MAEKDKKDLPTNQMTDSELEGAVGGAATITYYRVICGCGYQSDWTTAHAQAQNWKTTHLMTYPDHVVEVITKG